MQGRICSHLGRDQWEGCLFVVFPRFLISPILPATLEPACANTPQHPSFPIKTFLLCQKHYGLKVSTKKYSTKSRGSMPFHTTLLF